MGLDEAQENIVKKASYEVADSVEVAIEVLKRVAANVNDISVISQEIIDNS